jgi:hypothetical protein
MLNETTLSLCNPEAFYFYDVSDITNWQLLSSIEFTEHTALTNLAVLNENRLIIPFSDSFVELYDISRIEEPVLLSSFDYESAFQRSYDSVVCVDNKFYQVDSSFGIHQFKISNDQFEYLGNFPDFNQLIFTYLHNNILAVRTRFWTGMHFYDISDFNNIQYVCTHFDNYYQYGCDFEENLLAVPLVSFPDYDYNIDVYDITDIENPVLFTRIENIFAEHAFLEYPYLYTYEGLPSSNDAHFVKYNISEPFHPYVVYDYSLYPNMHGFFKYEQHFFYRGGSNTINILGNLAGDYPVVESTLEIDELAGFWNIGNGFLLAATNNSIYQVYSLENPTEPEFLFQYPSSLNYSYFGIKEELFFIGQYTTDVFDLRNGYDLVNPIYNFESSSSAVIKDFLEQNGEAYFTTIGIGGVSLFKYNFDNSSIFENEVSSNSISLSNFPNPFNPETTISFSLPKDAKVNLSIYNIKGQKVKTLVNQILPAGEHKIIWNGMDSKNKKATSGLYLYQMKTEFETVTNKMMLLK